MPYTAIEGEVGAPDSSGGVAPGGGQDDAIERPVRHEHTKLQRAKDPAIVVRSVQQTSANLRGN